MPLFIDGNISTVEDLRVYDSNVLHLANVEGVELSSKLTLAERELAVELQAFLARETTGGELQMPPSAIDLGRLVVTEPLRQWHCLRTLAGVYRDVYYSQLNDRYYGRWQEFLKQDRAASALLFEMGLGMVNDPVRRPMPPEIGIGPGVLPAATYYIRAAWVNSLGQEGQPSQTMAIIAGSEHVLTVRGIAAPSNATGWNVYAGYGDTELTRQNAGPLLVGSEWAMPDTGLIAGQPPAEGQQPDYLLRAGKVLQRG